MNSNFPYNVGANRLMVAEVNRDIILPTEYKDSNGIVKISNVSKKDALTYGIVIKVGKNVEEHLLNKRGDVSPKGARHRLSHMD